MGRSKVVMDIKDVAKYLDVSQMSIYRYAQEGKIPAFKIGGQWRFKRKSIDKWMEDKERFNTEKKERRKDNSKK
jgi:excisionase family DNA binding protein